MLITKYIVLDEDSLVFDDDTKETSLLDKKEAEAIAEFLKRDGSALVKVIPFKYVNNE
tara:strand:+ start:1118 stop:1291 length:174 start_codon:yes stop_codon:yes gene_type:complete